MSDPKRVGVCSYCDADLYDDETEPHRCCAGDDAREFLARIAVLEARCREQLEALREGAEYLHAFTPAGTPAVDAFIAKWSDRTALETAVKQ